MTDEERIQHMQVLWKKGRNMYGSFFTMLGEKRKEIGDEALSGWCMNQLHIGLYACLEVSKCLKETDRKMVQAELDHARRAEREKQRKEMEAFRLEQEAVKAMRDAANAETKRQIEEVEETAGRLGDFTKDQIAKIHHLYFDCGEPEIVITRMILNTPNASKASAVITRIVAIEEGRRLAVAEAGGIPAPKPIPKRSKGGGKKKRGTPLPPSAGPKPSAPTPTPPFVPTPAAPTGPIAGSQEFPKTLAAARAMEIGVSNYQWALGDALIEECGPPGKRGISDGSYERLAKAVEYLCANGVEHNDRTLRTLREYREVSYLYPNGTRVPSVSFSVHRVLDGPDWMTRILADLPAGEKLTVIKATEMADAIRAAQGNNVVPLRQPEVAVS